MTATPLLRLYQLLWEEIRDKESVEYLQFEIIKMDEKRLITIAERYTLAGDISMTFKIEECVNRKAFVLRRIEELKTKNQ